MSTPPPPPSPTPPPATPPPPPPTNDPTPADPHRQRTHRTERRHCGECVRDFACEPELLFVRHGPADALQPVQPRTSTQSHAFTFQHPPPALCVRSPFDAPVVVTIRAPSPPAESDQQATVGSLGSCASHRCERYGSPPIASGSGWSDGSGGSSTEDRLSEIVEDDVSSSGCGDLETPAATLHPSCGESMLDFVSASGRGRGEEGELQWVSDRVERPIAQIVKGAFRLYFILSLSEKFNQRIMYVMINLNYAKI